MSAQTAFMRAIGDDLAVVPGAVVSVVVTKVWDGQEMSLGEVWGVAVGLSSGQMLYRPAAEDTQESARDLLQSWIAFANKGDSE